MGLAAGSVLVVTHTVEPELQQLRHYTSCRPGQLLCLCWW
jgi:hypothetical protein